jgi:hypothetical protein
MIAFIVTCFTIIYFGCTFILVKDIGVRVIPAKQELHVEKKGDSLFVYELVYKC